MRFNYNYGSAKLHIVVAASILAIAFFATRSNAQKTLQERKDWVESLSEEEADALMKPGLDWMQKKALEPGVKRMKGGILYKILKKAPVGPKFGVEIGPGEGDRVKVEYKVMSPLGELIHETGPSMHYVFEIVPEGEPSEMIPGVIQGVRQMALGDRFEFYVPWYLAYGPYGSEDGDVPPFAPVVFDVTLVDVEDVEKWELAQRHIAKAKESGKRSEVVDRVDSKDL